jgi:hypothetical protein
VHEADHSPPSSSDLKNGGAIPPLPIRLFGVVIDEVYASKTSHFYMWGRDSLDEGRITLPFSAGEGDFLFFTASTSALGPSESPA